MRIHNTITKAYRAIPGTMLLVAAVLVSLIIAISASAGPISVASAGQEKVTVCHLPGTPAEVTLEIPVPAVPAHMAHGDAVGACPDGQQASGCSDLNAVAPAAHVPGQNYAFSVIGLQFNPGEKIHADITVEVPSGGAITLVKVTVLNGTGIPIAGASRQVLGGPITVMVDHVVVAGDDTDGYDSSPRSPLPNHGIRS